MRVLLFNVFLTGVFVYAMWKGGRDERAFALIWLAANLLTRVAIRHALHAFTTIEPLLFAIDLVTAAAFVWLATRGAGWIVWAAAFQCLGVVSHLVMAANPDVQKWVYQIFLYGPGWAINSILLYGTAARHRRQRAAAGRSSPG